MLPRSDSQTLLRTYQEKLFNMVNTSRVCLPHRIGTQRPLSPHIYILLTIFRWGVPSLHKVEILQAFYLSIVVEFGSRSLLNRCLNEVTIYIWVPRPVNEEGLPKEIEVPYEEVYVLVSSRSP